VCCSFRPILFTTQHFCSLKFRFWNGTVFVIARKVRLIHLIRIASCILFTWTNMIQQVCFVYAWSLMLYMFNRIDFVLDLLYKSVICWELNWHSNTWNKKVFLTFAQNAYLNTPLPLSDWIKLFFRFLLLAIQLTFFWCIHAYSRVILHWIHALYYLWLLIE